MKIFLQICIRNGLEPIYLHFGNILTFLKVVGENSRIEIRTFEKTNILKQL